MPSKTKAVTKKKKNTPVVRSQNDRLSLKVLRKVPVWSIVIVVLIVGGLIGIKVMNDRGSSSAATLPVIAGTRDPLKWPFSRYSIWNMPIGSAAKYVPANINTVPANDVWSPMPAVDYEYIIMHPEAPLTPMKLRYDWGGDRCTKQSDTTVANLPIPTNYIVPNDNGNNSSAFLMADGRTVYQAQPLARCQAGGYATSINFFQDYKVDIYGSGINSAYGAHGGSDLSALGGSLRVGELRKGGQPPRHALKVAVFRGEDFYRCTVRSDCFRWPAFKPDSGAVGTYGVLNNNQNKAMRMGALLAIPNGVNLSALNLETEPGKKLAWTFQNYGAYVNDDADQQFLIDAERGPDGDFGKQFEADYGFPIMQRVRDNTPWMRDMQRLVAALNVVDNNGPTTIGGGGTPLQPLAPCFKNGIECDDPNVSSTGSITPPPPPPPTTTPPPVTTTPPPPAPTGTACANTAFSTVFPRIESEAASCSSGAVTTADSAASGGKAALLSGTGQFNEYVFKVPSAGSYVAGAQIKGSGSYTLRLSDQAGTTIYQIATNQTAPGTYAYRSLSGYNLSAGQVVKLRVINTSGSITVDYLQVAVPTIVTSACANTAFSTVFPRIESEAASCSSGAIATSDSLASGIKSVLLGAAGQYNEYVFKVPSSGSYVAGVRIRGSGNYTLRLSDQAGTTIYQIATNQTAPGSFALRTLPVSNFSAGQVVKVRVINTSGTINTDYLQVAAQ